MSLTITKQRTQLIETIRNVTSSSFEAVALSVFRYQAQHNPLYRKYIKLLKIKPQEINKLEDIPFLPITFFKNYAIRTGKWNEQEIFTSSGTTGSQTSQHFVRDPDWYNNLAKNGFLHFYGSPKKYCFLALLPSYLERQGSSLIYMVDHFIQASNYPTSGFFLNELDALSTQLQFNQNNNIPTILLGVSFALLDFADSHPQDISNVIIMETGGMKGRRKEITRAELHQLLNTAFNTSSIHSEYGMTELFSQAYSKGEGLFYSTPTMNVISREVTDPLTMQQSGKTGVLNIIDLANLDTISFIATEDIGRTYENGSFEVLGRLDNSDIRGCNLLMGM